MVRREVEQGTGPARGLGFPTEHAVREGFWKRVPLSHILRGTRGAWVTEGRTFQCKALKWE